MRRLPRSAEVALLLLALGGAGLMWAGWDQLYDVDRVYLAVVTCIVLAEHGFARSRAPSRLEQELTASYLTACSCCNMLVVGVHKEMWMAMQVWLCACSCVLGAVAALYCA